MREKNFFFGDQQNQRKEIVKQQIKNNQYQNLQDQQEIGKEGNLAKQFKQNRFEINMNGNGIPPGQFVGMNNVNQPPQFNNQFNQPGYNNMPPNNINNGQFPQGGNMNAPIQQLQQQQPHYNTQNFNAAIQQGGQNQFPNTMNLNFNQGNNGPIPNFQPGFNSPGGFMNNPPGAFQVPPNPQVGNFGNVGFPNPGPGNFQVPPTPQFATFANVNFPNPGIGGIHVPPNNGGAPLTALHNFKGPTAVQVFAPPTYQNKKWIFSDDYTLKNQFQNRRNEFISQKIYHQNMNLSIQFFLSQNKTIWVEKESLNKLYLFSFHQNQFDLSILFDVTQRYTGVENALFYCSYGYIELDEEQEVTDFLLACLLLDIVKPFEKLQTYLSNPQEIQQNSHVLNNGDDIFDLLIFSEMCQSKQGFEGFYQYFQNNQKNHAIYNYLQLLIVRNPSFYINQRDQGFNLKLKQTSNQLFIGQIVELIASQLFPSDQQYVDIKQVETFHQLCKFYYSPDIFDNHEKYIETTFAKIYNDYIEKKLTEEDKFEVLKFMGSNKEILIKQLKEQYQRIKQLEFREKALVRVLIAQRAQNIAIDSFKDQFKQSINIVTGNQLEQDLENLIETEIQRMQQQNNY